MWLAILGTSNERHPRRTLQERVSLRLCGPVFIIPVSLKVGNMSVGNILEVTNPVYMNHMIVLTTVDSSSLSDWLPLLLDAQCELHHLALEFLQLILDCHCASLEHAMSFASIRSQGLEISGGFHDLP